MTDTRCPAFGCECEYVDIASEVDRASGVMEQAKNKIDEQTAEIERLRNQVDRLIDRIAETAALTNQPSSPSS